MKNNCNISCESSKINSEERVYSLLSEITGQKPEIEPDFNSNDFLRNMLDAVDKIDAKFCRIKSGFSSRYTYKTYLVDMSDHINALRMYCTYASMFFKDSLKYCLILNVVIDHAIHCIRSHKFPYRYARTVARMTKGRFPSRVTELFQELC